jgi:hypothetical protein
MLFSSQPGVAELADAADSKSAGALLRVGSTPSSGTNFSPAMLDTVLKRFDAPDEIRTFEKGIFELVRIGGMTIGRATYQPGWKWSVHVGPTVGATRCNVEHVGLVLSGSATAAMDDGTIHELRPGTLFYIPPGPPGHDSWVVGDAPCVSLHFLGADHYANK